MTEWPQVPPDPPAMPPSGLPSQTAAIIALITSIAGGLGAWRGYEGGQDTQRVAYEALRARSDLQGQQIEDLTRSQAEMRQWMADQSRQLGERASNTERVLRRVAKPKQVPPAILPPEPPPAPAPPPPSAEVRPATPLPTFDALEP